MTLYLWLKNLLESEEGQDLIEYALILVLVVIVAVVGLQTIGPLVSSAWTAITTSLSGGLGS